MKTKAPYGQAKARYSQTMAAYTAAIPACTATMARLPQSAPAYTAANTGKQHSILSAISSGAGAPLSIN
jgi:hypothetical protein